MTASPLKCIQTLAILVCLNLAISSALLAKQENRQSKPFQVTSAQLKKFMETVVERGLFHGAAIVVDSRKVIFELAHGDAERGKRASTVDSTFYLASVSKQFTATAIMLLQQDGKLSFDDGV